MNNNIEVIEKIARQVVAEVPTPKITGRGHAPRVRAPRSKAVFRVLAAAEVSTGSGSRCGFAAEAHVLEVAARAAKLGIVWDWDGRIAAAAAEKAAAEKHAERTARRAALYEAAGGDAARAEWFKRNPAASGKCKPGSNDYQRRITRAFKDALEALEARAAM